MSAGNDAAAKGPCALCGHSKDKHLGPQATNDPPCCQPVEPPAPPEPPIGTEAQAKAVSAIRRAGCELAEAAMHVVREFDGVHRLALAVSKWSLAIANEGGRGERFAEPQAEAAAPYPENDLASQLSRALDAKTELEIRVARLEAKIGRVEALHPAIECECGCGHKRCDECIDANEYPCPTIRALSAERTSGE